MALRTPVRLGVDDASGVAPARRASEDLAARMGFGTQLAGETAIVVTELATNLVRHAGGGEVVLRPTPGGDALDVIAWDRGPGIRDLARARADGYSTAGGSGTGLGAVQRLSATFDLQTVPGQGTVVVARIGAAKPPDVDGVALAMEGETASGDAWAQVREGDQVTVVLVDGLGHGDDAAYAAATATRELRLGLDPVALLERMHAALRPTRGAAAAVARLNLHTGALQFAGIGNIAATIVAGATQKSLASTNGTLGHRVHRIRGLEQALSPGALLVLHSDGCRSGWDLAAYPGVLRRDPLVTASLLVRDFARGGDDVSVVVARTRRDRT